MCWGDGHMRWLIVIDYILSVWEGIVIDRTTVVAVASKWSPARGTAAAGTTGLRAHEREAIPSHTTHTQMTSTNPLTTRSAVCRILAIDVESIRPLAGLTPGQHRVHLLAATL